MYTRSKKYPKKVVAVKRRRMPAALVSVPRAFRRDLQNYDVRGPFNTTAANVSYVSLFNPVQGTANSSRYGNKTCAYSLAYTIFIQVGTPVPFRIMFIHDKQPNQSFPTSPEPLTNLDTVSYKDPDTRQRFTILRDFWIGNAGPSNIASAEPKHTNMIRGYMKLKISTEFTGNTGTIADIQSGSIIMLAYNGGNTANAAVLSTRVLYES